MSQLILYLPFLILYFCILHFTSADALCKGVQEPSPEATFTGLVFDEMRGRVGLSRRRMWRIRLSFLHVADRGSATGDELRVLLGHFTWGALVRRELLSIFSAAYRFATWAEGRFNRPPLNPPSPSACSTEGLSTRV